MKRKLTFPTPFLKLCEAVERSRSQKDLITALQQGVVVARGRRLIDLLGGAGDPEEIPVSAWLDWRADAQNNVLQDDDNERAYVQIEILAADLEVPSGLSRGGRPPDHDWELILKQLAVWVSANPLMPGVTFDKWIKRIWAELPYCEANSRPEEDALKKKLRDLYRDLAGEGKLPVGRPFRKR